MDWLIRSLFLTLFLFSKSTSWAYEAFGGFEGFDEVGVHASALSIVTSRYLFLSLHGVSVSCIWMLGGCRFQLICMACVFLGVNLYIPGSVVQLIERCDRTHIFPSKRYKRINLIYVLDNLSGIVCGGNICTILFERLSVASHLLRPSG